jgi:hypothetical protein
MDKRWLGLWLGVLCAASLSAAPVRFDFESGDLQGWRVVEGSFGKLVCDRAVFWGTAGVLPKQGKWFLSTLETPDNRVSDAYLGVVESPVFTLTAPTMTMLVGGGSGERVYVALCTLDGKEHLKAQGRNDQRLFPITWQAPQLVGQRVFLRLVDGEDGGWRHITFDDFQAEGVLDPAATQQQFAKRKQVLGALAAPSGGDAKTLRAAIRDLIATWGARYPQGAAYLRRLDALEAGLAAGDAEAETAFAALQREALVANPLVSGQPLLYVVRRQYRPDHHNTETMFQTGEINTGSFVGGGALKSINLRSGEVKTLIDLPSGIVRDPEVHFSGQRIVCSVRRDIKDDYHLAELNADGSGLRQLTHAPGVSDIDPLYLPDDHIAFSSTREPKYCMCNRHIMANLFRMEPDGANIVQIGKNTLFEGHGALLPDGRVMYDRWEYVDRNFGDAQGLWTVNPDGTNHAVYYGNNTSSPGAVLMARPVPGTEQVLCVFSSCHDRPWGALALLDRRAGVDGLPPVVRTWPASAVKLVGDFGFDTYTRVRPKYQDPYPLSDRYFLCSRMTGEGERMGIYLVDLFGNEVLVHVEGPGCYDPMPLGPRPRPAVIPTRRDYDNADGYYYVANVYEGTHMRGVKPGSVKWLRVVESPEKRSWTHAAWGGQGTIAPAMNWHDFSNKRILGTVPVEADGSAYFTVPADRFVYFQLLDADGLMVQSMRSGTMVQSGERSGCVGCHEKRLASPAPRAARAPLAVGRPVSRLDGWLGEPRLFSYRAEVQPVLDQHCVRCHDFGKPAGEKLVLAGDRDLTFCASYNELWRRKLIRVVGAGPHQIQPAYSWGAHASKVVQVLRKGHQNLKLDAESLARLVTWIDLNAPYYPTYDCAYPSNLTGRSPLDGRQLGRLQQLTGVNFGQLASHSSNRGPQISFDRPALSPCLARLRADGEAKAADLAEALAIIQAGAEQLRRQPEADAPGFVACAADLAREAKYERRLKIELANREAIRRGARVYDAK